MINARQHDSHQDRDGWLAAILVIDVQQGLFAAEPPPHCAGEVIARINELLVKARQAGLPVIFVRHDGTAEENVKPHTPGWQLHGALMVDPADLHLRKTTCDAFFETDLAELLRQRGITRLVLAGFATDFCMDSTLRNAVSRGFEVLVAADAHTTHDSPVLPAAQIIAHHNWAWANCASKYQIRVQPVAKINFPAV